MQESMLNFFKRKAPTGAMQIDLKDSEKDRPWIEKYRPKTLDDISYQDEAVASFKGILKTSEMPHLLLYGPPGTGKTSIILALAHQLFGKEIISSRVLEMNASDDRGIDKVRNKIKSYASTVCVKNPNKNFKCPPFKIIILDEADNMTKDAQQALRRIIEDYSSDTRFCIICNYITKIIEPLSSRCIKFRFKEIPNERQAEKLISICKSEGITYKKKAINCLVNLSKGDLRKSTNLLQTVSKVHKNISKISQVHEIAGVVPEQLVVDLFETCLSKPLLDIINTVDEILALGYSASQVNSQMFNIVMNHRRISQMAKSRIIEKIAQTEKGLILGARDDLQLYELCSAVKLIKSIN